MKTEKDIAMALVSIHTLQEQAAAGGHYEDYLPLTAMQKILHWVMGNDCCEKDIAELLAKVKIEAAES